MNIVLGSNYESIVSETKRLANKTSVLKSKLSQIRTNFDEAYDGQIDYDTEIKALEKRLNTQMVRMSSLSNAINGAFDGLLSADSQSIEIDNGLKAILEVRKIISSDAYKEISGSIRSIISKYKDSKWSDIISSVFPPAGVGGVVIGSAVSVGKIISGVISDVVTPQSIFEERHWEEKYELWEEKRGTFVDMSEYPKTYYYYSTATGTKCSFNRPQCTWYAAERYRQMNGSENDLKFARKGGQSNNAKDWIKTIDQEKFNVSSTSDLYSIKDNTIAVKTTGEYGHVAYVEQVCNVYEEDGSIVKYVYYSEGGEGVTNRGCLGKIQKLEVSEFQKKFGYIISAK